MSSRIFLALRTAFHQQDSRAFRAVEAFVFLLIGISIVLLVLERVPRVEAAGGVLEAIDRGILALFALELVLRLITVRPRSLALFPHTVGSRIWEELKARLVYLVRPLTVIDLITVLTLFPGLRALRAVRLLRLLRTVKLFRYFDPLRAGVTAVRNNSLVYAVAFGVLLLSVLFGGLTYFFAEIGAPDSKIDSLSDALWWALVTITTVGYGDVTPVTPAGRVIASLLMVAGLFCIATFAGVVSHTLMQNVIYIRKEQLRMSTRTGHIVICGYDSITLPLLESLVEEFPSTDEPMIIFAADQPAAELPEHFTWIPGDATKESELDKVRLTHARAVIVTGRRDGRTASAVDAVTLLTIFTIRSYMRKKDQEGIKRKVPLQVVAEILDPENEDFALRSGADEVILTARLGLSVLAHTVAMPGTGTALGIVAGKHSQNLFVGGIPSELSPVPGDFGGLVRALKAEFDVIVLGLQDPHTGEVTLNPRSSHKISGKENVVYLGPDPFLGDDPGQRWTPGQL